MSNEHRTLIADLPVTEQEMTAEEMENVQGGIKGAEEKKKEEQQIAGKSGGTNPLPPVPGTTAKTTQNPTFGNG